MENEAGDYEGRLARTWEHSPDYREWTYHLRTDVRWHDGVPVTAHDVKFTLDLLGHPDVAERAGVEAAVIDDSTVRMRYAAPAPQPEAAGLVFYPRHLLADLDPAKIREWSFWTHPVGNGPFRAVRYLPETAMEFEPNPDYYQGKPRIERLILKFVGHEAITDLLSGSVDLVPYANPAHIRRLAGDRRFQVEHHISTNLVHALYWRTDHPLFTDPRVRQALTMGIDRKELLTLLSLPAEVPLVDGPFTKRQVNGRDLPAPLAFDPAGATALLEAAGWRDRDGDGIRERAGRQFRFTALVTTRESVTEMAQYVREALRRVGVEMNLQPLDQASVHERLRSGEYEAAFAFFRQQGGWLSQDFADTRLGNPAARRLIERARGTGDPDERDRIYRELGGLFQAEVPVTFLLPVTGTFLAHRRVQGLRRVTQADLFDRMDQLWVSDGARP
jgi:peptide/nickel transport system substrate-binding protein